MFEYVLRIEKRYPLPDRWGVELFDTLWLLLEISILRYVKYVNFLAILSDNDMIDFGYLPTLSVGNFEHFAIKEEKLKSMMSDMRKQLHVI